MSKYARSAFSPLISNYREEGIDARETKAKACHVARCIN